MINKNNPFRSKSSTTTNNSEGSAHEILMPIQSMFAAGAIFPRKIEQVTLWDAAGRVLSEDIRARFDAPLFDESMRDGYAVGPIDLDGIKGEVTFELVGETGAGDFLELRLAEGETWKVMTGGKVPGNCSRVVPQEWCRVDGRIITIDSCRLSGSSFVGRTGQIYKEGEVLVGCGEVITSAALIKIANGGWGTVSVYVQPRVCFCCTGKELVEAGVLPEGAEKVSSNQYLLGALLKQHGCTAHNYGIVGDEESQVLDFFNYSLHDSFDLVLTTGGTGGGAFDLVEKGFLEAGGTLICNSLNMRPGKSLVAGEKGATLYIGLPGPPSAAHTVFLEIVVPLLMTLKGINTTRKSVIEVIAAEDIKVKTRGSFVVKEGVLNISGGVCSVRKSVKTEFSTCNILIPPNRDYIAKGEMVEVHMRGPL